MGPEKTRQRLLMAASPFPTGNPSWATECNESKPLPVGGEHGESFRGHTFTQAQRPMVG